MLHMSPYECTIPDSPVLADARSPCVDKADHAAAVPRSQMPNPTTQQPGLVEEFATAIVNQVNAQRLFIPTLVQYRVYRPGYVDVHLKSATVGGKNGWVMRMWEYNVFPHYVTPLRVKDQKWGNDYFCVSANATAVALVTTLRAQDVTSPLFIYAGFDAKVALMKFNPGDENAINEIEKFLRAPSAVQLVEFTE